MKTGQTWRVPKWMRTYIPHLYVGMGIKPTVDEVEEQVNRAGYPFEQRQGARLFWQLCLLRRLADAGHLPMPPGEESESVIPLRKAEPAVPKPAVVLPLKRPIPSAVCSQQHRAGGKRRIVWCGRVE